MGINTGAIYAYPKLTQHPNRGYGYMSGYGYGYGHSHLGVHPCSSLIVTVTCGGWVGEDEGEGEQEGGH